MMVMQLFSGFFFFFGFFIKSFGVGSHLNCLDLIQMSPHNIFL